MEITKVDNSQIDQKSINLPIPKKKRKAKNDAS